jgi:hypothetical protein
MPSLDLQPIERSDNPSREHFQKHFYQPQKPVVLTRFSQNWPAVEKWTLDYFKNQHGNILVPIFEEAFANTGQSYTSADNKMRFGDYINLIQHEPSKLRMFLFNIFKHVPNLCNDFTYPNIIDNYLTKHPFMFFGGESSLVDVHYDLDLSDLFLTQFDGRKRVVMFEPKYSTHLYRHPLTVSSNVDIREPDFNRYPKLVDAKGYECILERGETLYMPRSYWHHVEYLDGGFSLTLRSLPKNPLTRAKSLWKIFNLTIMDHQLSNLLGAKRWYNTKEKIAVNRANRLR